MSYQSSITKDSLIYLVRKRLSKKHREKYVPVELQQAINESNSMQDLLDLLFSTDWIKNEAMIKAFDRRIDELETTF